MAKTTGRKGKDKMTPLALQQMDRLMSPAEKARPPKKAGRKRK